MEIKIVRHSYGCQRGQHTFTCQILKIFQEESTYIERDEGQNFLIKGRNLYPIILEHIQGEESKKISR